MKDQELTQFDVHIYTGPQHKMLDKLVLHYGDKEEVTITCINDLERMAKQLLSFRSVLEVFFDALNK